MMVRWYFFTLEVETLQEFFLHCVYVNVIDVSTIHKHLMSSILNYAVDINVLVVVISLDEDKYYSQGK